MSDLSVVAPAFVDMAHRIVWASVATADAEGRPRNRILHPIWEWDGHELVGWIGTTQSPVKRAHLEAHPEVSVNYWSPNHDTCEAGCLASWSADEATRVRVWNLFKDAPAPVGYDPTLIAAWTSPTEPPWAVLRLTPHRLRVFPGTFLLGQGGDLLTWRGSRTEG